MSFYATTLCPATTYGPFGNTLSETGVLAEDNVYRFSTKYFDADTELSYYGYRYYDAELGRWLSRDPIGEESFAKSYFSEGARYGKNFMKTQVLAPPYLFIQNNAVTRFDYIGLAQLLISAYFDSSTADSITSLGYILESGVSAKFNAQMNSLDAILKQCTTKGYSPTITLMWNVPEVESLPVAPSSAFLGLMHYYDFVSDASDVESNITNLPNPYGGIKVIFTRASIRTVNGWVVGTSRGTGIHVDIDEDSYILAHEVGHKADVSHCSINDTENLMHESSTPPKPRVDCDYCERVYGLAN